MQPNLDAEDKRKLHAEINQLANQRFLLCTAAITLFGAAFAWVISKTPPSNSQGIGAFAYAVSFLLTILLFVLFLINHFFKILIRTFSSYLVTTQASRWELDWKQYRTAGYFGYTKAQAILFLVLGVLSTLMSFSLAIIFSLNFEPFQGAYIVIFTGIVYSIFVSGMGFLNWFDKEKITEQRWLGIINKVPHQENAK